MSQQSRELFGKGRIAQSEITITAGNSTNSAVVIAAPTSQNGKVRTVIDELWLSMDAAGYFTLVSTASSRQLTPRIQFSESDSKHFHDLQLPANDVESVTLAITLPAAAAATVTGSYWIRYHEERGA